jgi:hypothetical protein
MESNKRLTERTTESGGARFIQDFRFPTNSTEIPAHQGIWGQSHFIGGINHVPMYR